MKRKGLKIFLATTICIFNLFICLSSVLAWFASYQINNAYGTQVQMYTYELDMEYRVFKYDEDKKEGVEVTSQPDALTLPKYDSIIKDRNAHTSIILEFSLSGIALGENIPINITSTCLDSSLSNKVISNIIKLQFAPIEINSIDENEIYFNALEYFNTNDIPSSQFKDNNTKKTMISYELTNYSSYLTSSGLNLFIRIDYSDSLISEFNFDINDSQTTKFENDIINIKCTTNENI